jgi:hypothetical protein
MQSTLSRTLINPLMLSVLCLSPSLYAATQIPTNGFLAKCRSLFVTKPVTYAPETPLYQRGPDNKYKGISSPKNDLKQDTSLIFDSFTDSPWLYTHGKIKLYEMEMTEWNSGKPVDKAAGYIAPSFASQNFRHEAYELKHMGSFRFEGRTYRLGYHKTIVKGFLWNNSFSYLGIYEKSKQLPVYFIQLNTKGKDPNFKIHKDENGISILIPRDDRNLYSLRISRKAHRHLEEQGFKREYISKTAQSTQPEFFSNTKKDWNVYLNGVAANAGYKTDKAFDNTQKLMSYVNERGETILVSGILWTDYLPITSPDKVIFFNRDRGKVEHVVEMNSTRQHAGRGFVEIGNGIFSLADKSGSYYTDLRVVSENGERYLIARQTSQQEASSYAPGADVVYNPGSSYLIHKISTGEQIVTFENKNQRIFVNEKGEKVEPPSVFKGLTEQSRSPILMELHSLDKEPVR